MNATPTEIVTVLVSRQFRDHAVVFAGVGTPLVAAALAMRQQAPHLTVVLEGGIIGTELRPGQLPISTNEMRAAYRAPMLTDISDIFLYAQRGFFDYGVLGVAQVDPYGNINTSVIGSTTAPAVRLPGSGGANDIISLCNETLIATTHEKRRFVERVDFITSPGNIDGPQGRQRAGLACGRVSTVVTDLGLFDFNPDTGRMRLVALVDGVSVADVQANTGFDVEQAPTLTVLPAPTDRELDLVRELNGIAMGV